MIPAPKFLPFPRPPSLLVIDAEEATARRYTRKANGKGYITQTAKIEPASVMEVLGDAAALAMLEKFRAKGEA